MSAVWSRSAQASEPSSALGRARRRGSCAHSKLCSASSTSRQATVAEGGASAARSCSAPPSSAASRSRFEPAGRAAAALAGRTRGGRWGSASSPPLMGAGLGSRRPENKKRARRRTSDPGQKKNGSSSIRPRLSLARLRQCTSAHTASEPKRLRSLRSTTADCESLCVCSETAQHLRDSAAIDEYGSCGREMQFGCALF